MGKKLYPNTDLDRKILKSANAREIRRQRIKTLAEFYQIPPESLDLKDPSPWRKLSLSIMVHLIPGFQVVQSGNKAIHSLEGDWEIYSRYIAPLEFGYESSGKRSRAQVCKEIGCTDGQAGAAISRCRKVLSEDPAIVHAQHLVQYLSPYATRAAAPDRYKKNRKKNIGTK